MSYTKDQRLHKEPYTTKQRLIDAEIPITVICFFCKQPFETTVEKVKSNRATYCSQSCITKHSIKMHGKHDTKGGARGKLFKYRTKREQMARFDDVFGLQEGTSNKTKSDS